MESPPAIPIRPPDNGNPYFVGLLGEEASIGGAAEVVDGTEEEQQVQVARRSALAKPVLTESTHAHTTHAHPRTYTRTAHTRARRKRHTYMWRNAWQTRQHLRPASVGDSRGLKVCCNCALRLSRCRFLQRVVGVPQRARLMTIKSVPCTASACTDARPSSLIEYLQQRGALTVLHPEPQ